jgi:hypothetical protein
LIKRGHSSNGGVESNKNWMLSDLAFRFLFCLTLLGAVELKGRQGRRRGRSTSEGKSSARDAFKGFSSTQWRVRNARTVLHHYPSFIYLSFSPIPSSCKKSWIQNANNTTRTKGPPKYLFPPKPFTRMTFSTRAKMLHHHSTSQLLSAIIGIRIL